jgi:hypothetical protein
MNTQIFDMPGELFLGSDSATAIRQGPRTFASAAKAIRFALEQAAPVHLRGALLRAAGRTFGPAQIRRLYRRLPNVARRGGRFP